MVDLSSWLAAPLCSTILADMGADVIRVEPPGGSEDRRTGPLTATGDNTRYLMLARGKRAITLDLRTSAGRELLCRLVRISDIVLENFNPPARHLFGVTYEDLRAIRSDVIVASVSAFGNDGPDRDRPGFDRVAQAESGAWAMTGHPEEPPVVSPVQWADMSTALYTTIGVVLALRHRDATGEGQLVETALLDTAASYVAANGAVADHEVLGMLRPRSGNSAYHVYSDAYETADGTITILAVGDSAWRRLARCIERPELAEDPRFSGDTARWERRELITQAINEWIAGRSASEIEQILGEIRIPCARIRSVAEMRENPQVVQRGLFEPRHVDGLGVIDHPRIPIQLSRTPARMGDGAPAVGAHNHDVYGGLLGLEQSQIASLESDGVI